MNLRLIDWIWHVRGQLVLPAGQSGEDALDRLDPLFHEYGTSYRRQAGTLTFTKKDQPAQDKMSIFDKGVLTIENTNSGPLLRYDLMSRMLLFCFVAPMMFLAFAAFIQLTDKPPKPDSEVKAEAAEKNKKDDKEKDFYVPLNPIDKFLGAPEPETPAEKKARKEKANEKESEDKPASPTPAYVFASIFAALYLVGRILEQKLVGSLFRKKLLGETPPLGETA